MLGPWLELACLAVAGPAARARATTAPIILSFIMGSFIRELTILHDIPRRVRIIEMAQSMTDLMGSIFIF
jgi:hypothetical protein